MLDKIESRLCRFNWFICGHVTARYSAILEALLYVLLGWAIAAIVYHTSLY